MNRNEYSPDNFSGTMLQLLGIFRLVLAVMLSAIYLISQKLWPLDDNLSKQFQILLLFYLGFLLFSTFLLKQRPFQNSATIRVFSIVDLILLFFLCYLTDGLDSPLIIMILISLMAHGAFLPLYQGLMLVGIATAVQLYFWYQLYDPQDYTALHLYMSDPYIVRIITQGVFTAFAVVLSNRWLKTIQRANINMRQKDRELQNSILLHEAVVQQLNNGIIVIDQAGQIILTNRYIHEWFMKNIPPNSALEEFFPKMYKRYTLWNSLNFTDRTPLAYQGNQFYVDFFRISSPTLEYTLIDIEQVDDVNQRAQQNKLAALGQLTAAIAHEIRNPMTSIFQASQLLKEQEGLTDLDHRLLDMINNNIHRANKIINKVLTLAKKEIPHLEVIPLAPFLENLRSEFEITYPEYSENLTIDLADSLKSVYFDRSQLEQVINNLLVNAITHSDAPKEELRIVIRGRIILDNPSIGILDNGTPIPEERQPHLFEPFFTSDREGTGLGLFLVREMCENNHAYVQYAPCDEEPLHGFRIIFSKHI